ncbi:aminoglycoside 6-adenylyltransferase [Oceanobacillus limi]|uniref:Aminoglycoside 6-adenylyltransferase n=1 Tax=Oceanobacillus limi TaxID=930131 RepID=A0A1I0CI47_9BACI|nr:aminoglycoside 6-adenylyltransferase [Oceanobacillus limi]SET19213.1 aminoglycoside 6-adenylyltransferase [Oceanobacillus limi]
MRKEKEMMVLILSVAEEDERIRGVAMNGSRTNPNAPIDSFQDFDIVYFVRDMPSFINNPNWVDVFGDRIIMQTPDKFSIYSSEQEDRFAYLMLFDDGNRIDLTLIPTSHAKKHCQEDTLKLE